MLYSEALEVFRYASIDVDTEYEKQFKRYNAGLKVLAIESMMGGFIEDHNEDVVTEALDSIKQYATTFITWFKNLFNKFSAMIRGLVFNAQAKKLEKMEKKGLDKTVVIDKEQLEGIKDALKELGNPMEALSEKLTAKDLAALCKYAFQEGKKINESLKKGASALDTARDPDTISRWMKESKRSANNCAKVMKVCIALIHKAVKQGVIQDKKGKSSDTTQDDIAKKYPNAAKANQMRPMLNA